MAVEVFVKYQIIHKQWEGTAVLLISAEFTTKKQAPKDNISQALFHPQTFFFFFYIQKDRERQKFPGLAGSKVKAQSCMFTGHKEWPIDWTQKSECKEMLPEQMCARREESSCRTAHLLSSCCASAHPGAPSPHAEEMKRCRYREALSLPQ